MEKTLKKFTYTVMAIAIMFILLISFVCGGVGVTYAATSSSEVLADLRKDPDFDESAYPYVKDDYGLYVIQIAESSNKELFVYAYQPCNDTYDLKGTKISISYGYSLNGTDLSPKLYNLRLVSTSGTLDKYYVEDFTVPNDGDRYYNIVEIFRMINTEIDGEQDPTNPKTDKAYPVGQQWYVCDLNDSKHYEMNTFNTLSVNTVLTSHLTFSDGLTLNDLLHTNTPTDCWFYCFNQEDYVIEHIYEADLNYSVCRVETRYNTLTGIVSFVNTFDEKENLTVALSKDDIMSYSGVGLFSKSYHWNRILSSSAFIEMAEDQGVTFIESDRQNILSSQWVFTFLETNRTKTALSSSSFFEEYYNVYDVGLLRLYFQDISGNYYDLGVVNDLTDPDDNSSGFGSLDFTKTFEDFWDMFVKIILSIAGVIILLLLLNFVTPVLGILKFVFKAVVYVISAPFKLLKSIFKKE